jgi:Asp-tRNA(Asn)/Glu-tRNA(Gln) amidotransferase A subunit family amidase
MPSSLIHRWSLTETVRDVLAERVDATVLTERALSRIAETEPRIRAWVRIDPDAAARRPGPAGQAPLRGIPVGVKDIIDVAGLPTECGSSLRRGAAPAADDAAVVSLLRGLGAVPLGKTVTTEFAYFSPGPTRNPAAPDHTPGGSSSGSAAAVAAGMVPLALGSQTAGSLTRPAAFCGVAGLVLTTGTVATDGVVGLSPSLDSLGLLTATVADLRTAWAATLGGEDALRRALAATGSDGGPNPRVLLWRPDGFGDLDPAMDDALDRAASRLTAAGAVIAELDPGDLLTRLADDHATIMAYEAARERRVERARSDRLSEPLAALLTQGAALPDEEFRAARERVRRAVPVVQGWLAEHDAVLGPAALGPAPAGIAATGTPILSRPWQALGLPAVTVPGMRDPRGLPLGVQLIGHRNDEEHLLAVASAVEMRLSD